MPRSRKPQPDIGAGTLIPVTNAIERLHEEFKRWIKTQTVLPCAETAAMLFWALLASGQITMRKVDGWQTLAEKPADHIIDLAACSESLMSPEDAPPNSNTSRDGTRFRAKLKASQASTVRYSRQMRGTRVVASGCRRLQFADAMPSRRALFMGRPKAVDRPPVCGKISPPPGKQRRRLRTNGPGHRSRTHRTEISRPE